MSHAALLKEHDERTVQAAKPRASVVPCVEVASDWVLTRTEAERFAQMLIAPPKPSASLIAAIKRYK